MRWTAFLFLFLLSACGYRFEGGEKIAVSVPYVIGDHEGELTKALIRALSNTSNFRYVQEGGEWILKAKILGSTNDRIGYRYDRDPPEDEDLKKDPDRKEQEEILESVERRKNLVGIENRKEVSVEVSVVNATTGKAVLGPQIVMADVDYDYDDPNSLIDLSFIDPETGKIRTAISFSLGQLDSVAAAGEDALYPLYRYLARKIVDGMIASGGECSQEDSE